jgi:hypothetical protein
MFPSSKNIKRILIYSFYIFSNYSNILNLEKKYSFKAYNKIINHFYVMRKFSFLFNYNYFKKRNFQQIKEISFFKDKFTHWHLNLNLFSKYINTHYNEYLYNYINKFFANEKKEIENKNNFQLIRMQDKYFKSVTSEISFFTFNRLKKKENLKHIIFSKKSKLDKIDFFFNLKTNFYYLNNKNLSYPNTLLIASMADIEKENAKLKRNLNDDLSLRFSLNKIERLMYLRKKARKLLIKRKKFKKIRKKIRIFGEDEIDDINDFLKSSISEEDDDDFDDFKKSSKSSLIKLDIKNEKGITLKSADNNFLPFIHLKDLFLRCIKNDDEPALSEIFNQRKHLKKNKKNEQIENADKIIKDEFGRVIKRIKENKFDIHFSVKNFLLLSFLMKNLHF